MPDLEKRNQMSYRYVYGRKEGVLIYYSIFCVVQYFYHKIIDKNLKKPH